jgi:hypothetical protein
MVLDFRTTYTVVHFKLSPLICHLNAEYGLSYTADIQTCKIQPMDQSVIATFKWYYMKRATSQAIKATDMAGGPTLKEFWKGNNIIWNAMYNIGDSWA